MAVLKQGIIYLLSILPITVEAISPTWNLNASGNWNLNGNWTGGVFPNTAGDTANFLNIITANRTVTLGIPITVGNINFDDNNNYLITANTLTLNNGGPSANVTITNANGNGAHTIASALTLVDNLSLSQSSTAAFTISGLISGVGKSLTKVGTQTLILSNGGNTYSGATTINAGTLQYNTNGCINTASAVTVGNGIAASTLNINATMTAPNALNVTISALSTLAGTAGTAIELSSLQGSGTLNLGVGTRNIDVVPTANVVFSGDIAGGVVSASTDPTVGNRLTKAGTTTLTLSSATSSYISRTFIGNGVLDVQASNALGIPGASSAVYVRTTGGTGTLQLQNNILLPKTVFLNGAGSLGNGALRNLSGNNTISGTVQIGWASGATEPIADATIQVDPGVQLTLSGALSGTRILTKTGSGQLNYTGALANTLSGNTVINAGTINLNKTGVNGLVAPVFINATGILLLSGPNQILDTTTVTLQGGTFNMNGNNDTIGLLAYTSGTMLQSGGVLTLSSAAATALSMGNGTADTTIPGDLAFSAAGGVTFTGPNNTATIVGNVNLATFAHAFNIATSTATVSMDLQGVISGTGTITKSTGTGILQFSGTSSNLYSGLTTVTAGTLRLNKTAGIDAIAGNVTVNGGTLQLAAADQIADTFTVTLSSGTFDMAGNVETIGSLVFTGGTLTQGGALLTLASNATALTMGAATITGDIALSGTGGVSFNGAGAAATFSPTSTLDLGSITHTFTITNGAATPDMDIQGVIKGVGGGVTKAGTGANQLNFSGTNPNTYTGLTTVTQGTLLLTKTAGVNAIGGSALISAGTLQLGAASQIPDTATVTIAGGTFNMNGNAETIDNLVFTSGTLTQAGATLSLASSTTALTMRNTTIAGPIAFTGSGNIVFDSTNNGTATISGTVDLGGFTHTFDIANGTAANDMTISNAISNGAVTKISAGRLQFSGGATANTYVGLTTVSSGTLILNKTAGTNAIAGDVLINGGTLLLGAANQIVNTATMTISSGTFDRSGSAETIDNLVMTGGTVIGAGTFTLTPAGPTALTMGDSTSISGGTLSLSGTGGVIYNGTTTTATISSAINLNAGIHSFTIAAPSMDLQGVISGAGGGITKLGPGQLRLSGGAGNSYTGLTTVSAGELLLQKTAGNAIAADVLINTNGTVTLGNPNQITNGVGNTVTLAGGTFNMAGFVETIGSLIFNSGTLSQGGATLTFANATSTALTMNDGTLVSGPIAFTTTGGITYTGASTTATISGPINLGAAAHTFDIADGASAIDMLVSGVISGAGGSLTKIGAGTLLLTGANSYGGGTTVTAGTLQGDTTSLQGNIIDNANLVFDQAAAGTYAGVISGAGTLTKQGNGALTFTSASTLGGLTTISAGTFLMNGSLGGAGTTTVSPGARLGGTGTISQNVTVLGTLAPGNSIDTIHLVGAQLMGPGSTLEIEHNATTSDLVDVAGTFTIQPGSTLSIVPAFDMYNVPTIFIVVQTTSGVTGTFSSVVNTLPLFTEIVSYTTNQVLVEIIFEPFARFITRGKAAKVARCLDTFSPAQGSDLEFIINDLFLSPTIGLLEKALIQLQPSQYTSLAIAQENDAMTLQSAILSRLETSPCRSIWISPIFSYAAQHSQDGEPGFKVINRGVFVGIDGCITKNSHLGGGIAYTNPDLTWNEHQGSAHMRNVTTALYGNWKASHFYIESSLMGSYNMYDTDRHIHFTLSIPINRHAKGRHHGFEGSGHLKAALTQKIHHTSLSLFAETSYIYLTESSFKEHGAKSLDLDIKTKKSSALISQGGFDLSHCFRATTTLFAQFCAIRESRFQGQHERAGFNTCSLTVSGLNPSRTLAGATVGLTSTPLSLFYKGRYGKQFQEHSAYLQLMFKF